MALRKPSDYFDLKKEVGSVGNSINELAKFSNSDLNSFSKGLKSTDKSSDNDTVISGFYETFDNYRINLENVNHIFEEVKDMQKQISSLLKKEDLDQAMVFQLMIVEKSIQDLQNKVKALNEKNITEIRSNVSDLTNSINEFFEIDVPKYKKLIVESEIRTTNKYEKLEESVNRSLDDIGEFVNQKYTELTESLEGINEKRLSDVLENFKILENNLQKIQEEDIPKYRGFIVESEIKVDSTINKFNNNLDKVIERVFEKVNEVESEIENISFNNEKLVSQSTQKNEKLVSEVTQKINDIKKLSNRVVENLKNNESYKTTLNQKINDLQVEVVRNESHIKTQTKTLKKLQEEVKESLGKINFQDIEEKHYKLGEKIKYIEEVFERFSEKEILTENIAENLLTEPPSTENKDSLTPLDQKYVTLDQLQEHYRLFINRIQQQLASLGGGGETRLKYLDDVVGIATNAAAYDNKYLKYNHALGKFEFATVTSVSTSDTSYWVKNNVGINTVSNIGIGTDNSISQISVGPVYGLDTNVIGVTTTVPSTINTFSSDLFRSARFQIQITQGSDYQATDLLAIHNGTTVNLIEYGSISTGDYLASFNSIIVGNEALLQVSMNNEDYAEIKVVSQKITI